MAFKLADRVLETSTSTGTGSFVLAGARDGYQSFTDALANGDTTYYTITDGTDWEVGLGTWTESTVTLARTTVFSSSNSGSAVNFGAGTKEVFISYPANKFWAELVDDPSPQLGGNLNSNGQDIRVYDGDKLLFGDGVDSFGVNHPDMEIYHDSSSGDNHIEAYNGVIHIGGGTNATGTAKLVFAAGSGAGGSVIELNSNANTVPQQVINAKQASADFDLQHNGSNKITLNTSGVTFHDSYTFPTSDGSANQVLQTDGNGQLSFADASGGSESFTTTTGYSTSIDNFFNLDNDWKMVELVVANQTTTNTVGNFYAEYGITGVDTTIQFTINRIFSSSSGNSLLMTSSINQRTADNMISGGASLRPAGVFFLRMTRRTQSTTDYISFEVHYPDSQDRFVTASGIRNIALSSNQKFIKIYKGGGSNTPISYAIRVYT